MNTNFNPGKRCQTAVHQGSGNPTAKPWSIVDVSTGKVIGAGNTLEAAYSEANKFLREEGKGRFL